MAGLRARVGGRPRCGRTNPTGHLHHHGRHRDREHVDQRRRRDRGVVPANHLTVWRPVAAGVGIGHPEANSDYRQPYATMVDYLDRLDAGGVPRDRRILAALGPRALRLAADRTLGTHPYLVVPEHTREAREMLGPGS